MSLWKFEEFDSFNFKDLDLEYLTVLKNKAVEETFKII